MVTKERLVIKAIERGKTCNPAVLSELRLHHSSFGHPYIADLKDAFLTQNYLCIAMSYAPGDDLDTIIKTKGPLTEDMARRVFQQILLAVHFLHQSGFVNRDIRTKNIMLDENEGRHIVKLTDFLYGRHDQINSDPRAAFASLPYTSPELLTGASKSDVGESANVWELGVSLYKLVVGRFPFEREGDGHTTYRTVPMVISRISTVDYSIPDTLSPALRDLLGRIFVVSVRERISLEDIMAHPWVNTSEWPATPASIAQIMKDVTCPVSQDVLDGVIKGSVNPGIGRSTTRSTEDELIDAAAADTMLEDQALQALNAAEL